jgi:D-alanyl-D-alanine carboxypeptidase/D-alanyl-D-alanine-endopeptidase (penicillin-binding protein 4)
MGPRAAITTTLLTTGTRRRGVLHGDVYLRGAGNPAFGSDEGDTDMDLLAQQLRRGGVRSVRGSVFGDGSLFDSRTGGPDSGWRTSIFIGPLSALTFNRGKSPAVEGAFAPDPALAAARALRATFQKHAIRVSGGVGTGHAPSRARVVGAVASRPLERLVQHMMKWSDGFSAEILLKRLAAQDSGRRGSTALGAREVSRFARRLGVRAHLRDGSGLCRKNTASPRDIVRLLDRLRKRPNFPAFFTSLPVAGLDGTLHDRMRSSPARNRCSAKTATLSDVSNLSGYCRTQQGHTLVFSFLMDNLEVASARRLQDRMVASLACYQARARGPTGSAGLYRPPVLAGGRRKMIALTFDDGPSSATPAIVSTLRRMRAGATFFQVGSALHSGEPIGAAERRHDLTIGTHTFRHPALGRLSRGAQVREILAGARALTRHGAPFPGAFRPPYDSYTAETLDVLRRLRMRMVLYNVDTEDWHFKRDQIVWQALRSARPGSIILMHDGGGNRSETVAALPAIIRGLQGRGYRVVSVPTLLRENPPPRDRPVPFSACPRPFDDRDRTLVTLERRTAGRSWSPRAVLQMWPRAW